MFSFCCLLKLSVNFDFLGIDFVADAEEKLVTSRRKIVWNYAKSWMVVDVLAVFPYELVTPNNQVEAAQLAKVRLTCLAHGSTPPTLF
eukprot:scaffold11558_cov47-Prasinocladus_malaysianus.AAC.2